MLSPLLDTHRQALVEARQLTRADAHSGLTLLQPTDFQLNATDRVAITGRSGSGKSVLLRTLALLEAPSAGEVLWHGQPVSSTRIPSYRSHVGYLSQRPGVLDGTVEANLRFPYSLKVFRGQEFDRAKVLALLANAGKEDGFLDKSAAELSGGEAQIMALTRVLQLDPRVLLLDEPTAALDPVSVAQVESLVHTWFGSPSGEARAYAWVTHDLEQARRISTVRMTLNAGVLTRLPSP